MIYTEKSWVCVECGYSSSRRFNGDICPKCKMTYWQCTQCGFAYAAEVPSPVCPECGNTCDFNNISGYIPDWDITMEDEKC